MFCTGQKYLLKELRRHLEQGTSLPQQLQSQLATFDRQTRNYCSSLTAELPSSTQNYTPVPLEVATRYAPDVLVALGDDEQFSPSASGTANSGNQHVPVAEARRSEQDAASSSFQALSPSYYSADESHASQSPNAGENHTPNHFSDVDDDEEFDAADEVDESNTAEFDEDNELDEYSNDESFVDDDFHSRGYQEYFDSDDHSERSVGPEEAYTDSENDWHDSRRADGESTNRPRRALRDIEEGDNYNDGDDDVLPTQTDGTTGSLQATRDEHAADRADGSAYAGTGHNTAGLSEEDRMPVRLRLNGSDAGSRYQDVPRGFSDDVSVDEDDAASRHDASDDQSSDGDTDYSYRQSRRRHRSTSSSTSTSPSLHADDDEVYSPVLSPAEVHDVDDDADARRQNSGDNAEASSERRNLHSRSDTERDQNRRPVSRASSSGSSRSSHERRRRESSQRASSGSESDGSWLASDTSADSDDSSSAHRRGVKRRRSVGSATDSDADQHGRKLHRFR